VEVHIGIEPSFGKVSVVGPGIHVLDVSSRASRGRGFFLHGFWHFFGIFAAFFSMGK